MSPTSSSRFLAGRYARSATLLTTLPLLGRNRGFAHSEHYAIVERPRDGAKAAGIVTPAVRRSRLRRGAGLGLCAPALCALLVAGCGEAKQDAGEAKRTYSVAIAKASFPARQAISKPTMLQIAVRNTGDRAIPDVAVTVDSLSYRAAKPANLADPTRPTWIVYRGPGPITKPPVESEEVTAEGGAGTAFVHTWALGRLGPHQTKLFAWRLLPVVSGTKTIRYAVVAGLNGKARAQLAGGGRPTGSFVVHIAPKPRSTHVNPETGAVAQGAYTAAPGPVGAVP